MKWYPLTLTGILVAVCLLPLSVAEARNNNGRGQQVQTRPQPQPQVRPQPQPRPQPMPQVRPQPQPRPQPRYQAQPQPQPQVRPQPQPQVRPQPRPMPQPMVRPTAATRPPMTAQRPPAVPPGTNPLSGQPTGYRASRPGTGVAPGTNPRQPIAAKNGRGGVPQTTTTTAESSSYDEQRTKVGQVTDVNQAQKIEKSGNSRNRNYVRGGDVQVIVQNIKESGGQSCRNRRQLDSFAGNCSPRNDAGYDRREQVRGLIFDGAVILGVVCVSGAMYGSGGQPLYPPSGYNEVPYTYAPPIAEEPLPSGTWGPQVAAAPPPPPVVEKKEYNFYEEHHHYPPREVKKATSKKVCAEKEPCKKEVKAKAQVGDVNQKVQIYIGPNKAEVGKVEGGKSYSKATVTSPQVEPREEAKNPRMEDPPASQYLQPREPAVVQVNHNI